MKVSQDNASTQPQRGRFDQVFQMASEATGTSFEYLLATAKRESSLRPDLQARTSSATGLFQFVEQTWLSMVKSEGAELGLSTFADAITVDARGRASVADPAMRQQILDLRKDPTLSAVMAGRLTRKNAEHLERTLGRAPTEGELYIAHFMGPSGASRLIDMASRDPLATAATAFPRAAEANRPIFFDRTGRARGAAEVYTELVARHPDQARQVADTKTAATTSGDVAASRVAVAFNALPEDALALAAQPLAPNFDGFRAKSRAEPFTARAPTSARPDPFRAVLTETPGGTSAPDVTATDVPLGYAATPPRAPAPIAAPAPPPATASEVRRSRFVTDPATWGAQPTPRPLAAATARPERRTGEVAPRATAEAIRPLDPAPARPAARPNPAPTQTAGIVAAASGPANANRGINRQPPSEARPLDLTGFLSYRVQREPKDLLPPL